MLNDISKEDRTVDVERSQGPRARPKHFGSVVDLQRPRPVGPLGNQPMENSKNNLIRWP